MRFEQDREEDLREEGTLPAQEATALVPTSRVYVHPDCGGETDIAGNRFYRVADPFEFVSSTYCAGCGRYVGLSRVHWEGRRDSIRVWRGKMRAKAPPSLKSFRWVIE